MKDYFKLMNYKEIPVNIKYWVFLLPIFLDPITCLVIWLSVLIHEMAHANVAKKLGYKVEQIYLHLIHGAAEIEDFDKVSDEDVYKIAFAGPKINILLGLLSIIPLLLVSVIYTSLGYDRESISFFSYIIEFFDSMIIINLFLGIFNLLPIYPLDGGRIFKSVTNRKMEKTKSNLTSGIVSGVFSLGLITLAIFTKDWILGIFSLLFLIISFVNIKDYKNE